jgi:hypothetical protein
MHMVLVLAWLALDALPAPAQKPRPDAPPASAKTAQVALAACQVIDSAGEGPMWGNVALWFHVRRLRTRDTVLVLYSDSYEGEPYRSGFWLLDGRRGTAIRRDAWSVQPTADEKALVFGVSSPMTRKQGKAPAWQRASYHEGFIGEGPPAVVSPVILDLATGKQRLLPIPGGGVLGLFEGEVIGLPRPGYWEFPFWEERDREPPRRLDLQSGRWLPLAAQARPRALALLKEPPQTTEQCDFPNDLKVGDVVIATRDRRMGLVVVDAQGEGAVRAARLPKQWTGQPLCPEGRPSP